MERLKLRKPGRLLSLLLPALLMTCCLEAIAGPPAGDVIRVGGTGTGTLLLQRMAESYLRLHPATQVKALMPPLGGSGGLRALAASALDLAIVSSPPHDESSGSHSVLWVRTPLAMVARGLPDESGLSSDQLADIFSGRLAQWPDGRPIRLVLRSARESDLKVLRATSPQIDSAVGLALKRNGIPVAENDIDNQHILERTPSSFGVISLGQLMLSERPLSGLTPLRIDGVPPSTAALRSRAYPYEKPLYLVIGKTASAATRDFVAYLQSPAALEVLARLAFIPAQR